MPLFLKLDLDVEGKAILYARNNDYWSLMDEVKARESTVSQALRSYASISAKESKGS